VDETHPYSRRFESPYSESKALAEQLVRAANGAELKTVSIRPHMIWGPGQDSHWVGGLRKLAKRGMLYQIGPGTNRVGMTFMDDCVSAHVAAWNALDADAAVGGQAFFVHGGTPISLWTWVRDLVNALGVPGIRGTIPGRAATVAGAACDALVNLSGGAMHFPISRYLITELTTDHYSSIGRARAWLGYEPQVSVEEGIARMAEAERASRGVIQAPAAEPSLTT
jgi:nucleoside-diphosphate-sugar epimerase